MLSELECGICYRQFDPWRRCPLRLHCKHSFCESCLMTLAACGSDDSQSGSQIICAFCRHTTSLQNQEKLRDMLPVDQDIMERLEEEDVLEESASDSEEDEEPSTEPSSQTKAEQIPRSRRGRLWSSVKRLYKKFKGQDQQGCITNDEMRDLALMACYMM